MTHQVYVTPLHHFTVQPVKLTQRLAGLVFIYFILSLVVDRMSPCLENVVGV